MKQVCVEPNSRFYQNIVEKFGENDVRNVLNFNLNLGLNSSNEIIAEESIFSQNQKYESTITVTSLEVEAISI